MRIAVALDHRQALGAYRAAGGAFPAIPDGANTAWAHFTTADGLPAVIVNQRGFAPTAEDDEEELNGCSLAIALDAPDEATARATIEDWVKGILEVA